MRRDSAKRVAVFAAFLVCLAVIAILLFNIDKIFPTEEKPISTGMTATEIKKEKDTVYIDGEAYLPKEQITNYLLIGVDSEGKASDRGSAQADFILLLSFNDKEKTYAMVQINRDTMTEVDEIDILGTKVKTRVEQIALSHSYGDYFGITNEKKCMNTSKSVSRLLFGAKIERYISMTMGAVPALVDAIGGVDMTFEEDLTEIDPEYKKGATVTLFGEDAMTFVQARGSLSNSTNVARMERQREFISAFRDSLKGKNFSEEALLSIYENASDYIFTDGGSEDFEKLATCITEYEFEGFLNIEGESAVDEFMQFYPDRDSLLSIVKELFYVKAE